MQRLKIGRESAVGVISGGLITFTAWAWGGVVLWTQWVVAGFGLLALVVALFPSTRAKWQSRSVRWNGGVSLVGGFSVFLFALIRRLIEIHEVRASTLQLIPDAQLPPLTFKDWGYTPLLLGLAVTLFLGLLSGLSRSSGARRRLLRFWPFWLGLFLFAWITCQSLNPWGKVIQRDLFWHIVPQDYITWLPSGLDAPFDSMEEPGGMNGWRQLLIWVGPWALLCALHVAVQRRRIFGWLSILACFNALGVALAGNLAAANKWSDFLGFRVLELSVPPFGPFVYKNHAGAYLSLAATLTLAVMFYLARRRGDKVDRGGPHLVVGLGAFFLVLGAASTMSFAAVVSAGLLLLVVAPIAYLFDKELRSNLSILPVVVMVSLAGIIGYVGLLSADARKWRKKIENKQKTMDRLGSDDRAPLRNVTWQISESAPFDRFLSGYGAGSFRWVSPSYMEGNAEFNNRKGVFGRRATHAHNDWLQSIAELGLAGWITAAAILLFIAARARAIISRPSSAKIALLGGLSLYSAHAFFDFLLFIPHLTLLAVVVAWIKSVDADAIISARR